MGNIEPRPLGVSITEGARNDDRPFSRLEEYETFSKLD